METIEFRKQEAWLPGLVCVTLLKCLSLSGPSFWPLTSQSSRNSSPLSFARVTLRFPQDPIGPVGRTCQALSVDQMAPLLPSKTQRWPWAGATGSSSSSVFFLSVPSPSSPSTPLVPNRPPLLPSLFPNPPLAPPPPLPAVGARAGRALGGPAAGGGR